MLALITSVSANVSSRVCWPKTLRSQNQRATTMTALTTATTTFMSTPQGEFAIDGLRLPL